MQPQRIPASALLLSSMLLLHRKHWKIEHGNEGTHRERKRERKNRQLRVEKKMASQMATENLFIQGVRRVSSAACTARDCVSNSFATPTAIALSHFVCARRTLQPREHSAACARRERSEVSKWSLRLVKRHSRRAICCCAKWSNYCSSNGSNSHGNSSNSCR